MATKNSEPCDLTMATSHGVPTVRCDGQLPDIKLLEMNGFQAWLGQHIRLNHQTTHLRFNHHDATSWCLCRKHLHVHHPIYMVRDPVDAAQTCLINSAQLVQVTTPDSATKLYVSHRYPRAKTAMLEPLSHGHRRARRRCHNLI